MRRILEKWKTGGRTELSVPCPRNKMLSSILYFYYHKKQSGLKNFVVSPNCFYGYGLLVIRYTFSNFFLSPILVIHGHDSILCERSVDNNLLLWQFPHE